MGKKKDRKIKLFANIIKNKFDVDKIIFFGSRARGTHKRNSDYDFILVSKDFRGMKFTERISKIYPYWKYDESIEPLCYTPKEFNKLKKQVTIVKEAVENGIEIR
ncbi:nucleotidyltransferase domain-containing protein [Candidatus Woesearchaeota archaeon]|nr:nucleotidyltransferase domain-containing protein [Candidatus Woesearchaeota archaeon]